MNVHRTQVKYVNVLTLSSLRSLAGEEISCESTLREEQGIHHTGQYSKFVSVFLTCQRPLLFFNAKVRTNYEFYVRAFAKLYLSINIPICIGVTIERIIDCIVTISHNILCISPGIFAIMSAI